MVSALVFWAGASVKHFAQPDFSTICTSLRSAHVSFIPSIIAVLTNISDPYIYCQKLQAAAT